MTTFLYKSFENGNRKHACPCTFICLDGGRINCVLCTREGGEKHEGKQRFKKQRGSCRSQLLPGIVRKTDEGAVEEKWEHYKTGSKWTEAIESIPLAKLGNDYGDFLFLVLSVTDHQWHISWYLIWSFKSKNNNSNNSNMRNKHSL